MSWSSANRRSMATGKRVAADRSADGRGSLCVVRDLDVLGKPQPTVAAESRAGRVRPSATRTDGRGSRRWFEYGRFSYERRDAGQRREAVRTPDVTERHVRIAHRAVLLRNCRRFGSLPATHSTRPPLTNPSKPCPSRISPCRIIAKALATASRGATACPVDRSSPRRSAGSSLSSTGPRNAATRERVKRTAIHGPNLEESPCTGEDRLG